MNNYKFKAGDKVYFPKISTKIFTLKKGTSEAYPIQIEYTDVNVDSFTLEGLLHRDDENSSLILATKENRLLLNKLYNVEFEEPMSKDLIIAKNIEEKGYCLCLVSDDHISKPTHMSELYEIIEVITKYDNKLPYPYISSLDSTWSYAEPIEINSDGTITYLADI